MDLINGPLEKNLQKNDLTDEELKNINLMLKQLTTDLDPPQYSETYFRTCSCGHEWELRRVNCSYASWTNGSLICPKCSKPPNGKIDIKKSKLMTIVKELKDQNFNNDQILVKLIIEGKASERAINECLKHIGEEDGKQDTAIN